ncbi:MAG TPA: hypothetical protein VHC49_24100 [Mycobacteriales bacterium]|nr:hypothetical protein [Mycobacteriales bacterium]
MRSFEYEISKARYEDLLAAAAKARQIQAVPGRRSTRQALGGALIALGRRLEQPAVRVA